MALMEWNQCYSVKVAAFDREHKQLFEYFNSFYDALSQKHGQAAVGEVLEKICKYAAIHFSAEEKWMEKNKFPGLAEHRAEHKAFAEKAAKLLDDTKQGRIVLSGSVSKMLREWLTTHIMGSDKKYGEFALQKGLVG